MGHLSIMDTAPRPFDVNRFGKLWSVANSIPHGTDNAAERATAWRMAEAMAARAGMTLNDAVAATGGALDRFPLDPLEQAIRAAGIDLNDGALVESLPLYRFLRTAIPWPVTIRAAVAEFERWDAIEAKRAMAVPGYRLGKAASVRRDMLAIFISDHRASGIGEAVARAAWVKAQLWRPGRFGFQEKRAVQTMAEDMDRMADKIAGLARKADERPPQPQPNTAPLRRTGAMKRATILFILDEPGGDRLTLRQIADRAGVSPETVRRVKRERATR